MKALTRTLAILALLNMSAAVLKAGDGDAFRFFEEEAVVITSAKRAQPVTKAAASASVITAEQIRLYGYRTLGEALQSVPGFYATDDRSYTYLWVRGFGRPGGQGAAGNADGRQNDRARQQRPRHPRREP